MLTFRRKLNGFMNRRMFRRLGDEELIQAKTQKISKIDIYVCASERADPKVEEGQVSQNAIEKFERETAVSGLKSALRERIRNDRISELLFCSPCSQRGESNSASRGLGHEV